MTLEGWLPETHQRPDIMFRCNNEQYVLEFQCSPISSEYLERHELYQAANIHDIWILGTEKYNLDFSGRTRAKAIESYTDIYFDVNKKKFNIGKNEIVGKLYNYTDYCLSHLWVKSNSLELNSSKFKFEICDEYIAPYLEIEHQKQIEKEEQEKRLVIYSDAVSKYVDELNLIYYKVKHHCRFKFYNRNEKSPYYVKIDFTSDVFNELIFFIKDGLIDICEPYEYKKPWYAYSSKKHCNTIHGWDTRIGYRTIDQLQFDANQVELIKKLIWDYISNKLQNYFQNKVNKY